MRKKELFIRVKVNLLFRSEGRISIYTGEPSVMTVSWVDQKESEFRLNHCSLFTNRKLYVVRWRPYNNWGKLSTFRQPPMRKHLATMERKKLLFDRKKPPAGSWSSMPVAITIWGEGWETGQRWDNEVSQRLILSND